MIGAHQGKRTMAVGANACISEIGRRDSSFVEHSAALMEAGCRERVQDHHGYTVDRTRLPALRQAPR